MMKLNGTDEYRNYDALTVSLATALIHYESPKHHLEAKSLFETVLKHNTAHTSALVGLGLILEEQQDYSGGADLLHQALSRDPDNIRIKAEAAWCDVLQGNYEGGKEALESCLKGCIGTNVRSRDLKAQILWRIGSAMWDNEGKRSNCRRNEMLTLRRGIEERSQGGTIFLFHRCTPEESELCTSIYKFGDLLFRCCW